ncbi:MAG: hypothetical protein ACREBU_21920 [Nitrososphaera sp.]
MIGLEIKKEDYMNKSRFGNDFGNARLAMSAVIAAHETDDLIGTLERSSEEGATGSSNRFDFRRTLQ